MADNKKNAVSKHLSHGRIFILLSIFLLSGGSSLAYQILWVRSLSLTLGNTVFAISIVVSAFMAGLALGSAFFGVMADRGRNPLRLYAVLEGAIGIIAMLMPSVFEAIGGDMWLRFVLSFMAILVPTTLMGGTLPVLSRFAAGFSGSRGGIIGALYSFNTIGAIAGTAVTGFILIRAFGMQTSTYIAAGTNLAVCAASLVLARRWPETADLEAQLESPARQENRRLVGIVTGVYFVNGLAGVGLEVLWTRAIVLFTFNTIYAFTVILTTFLAGLAMGSSLMSLRVARLDRPATMLGGLQCLIALIVALTPIALAAFGTGLFRSVRIATDSFGTFGPLLSAYAIAIVFMLPATMLMGASFPLVARVVADSTSQVGRAVGRVYAVNTIGGVLGSLIAGFLLLPWLGIQRSVLVAAIVVAVAGLTLIIRTGSKAWLATGSVIGISTVCLLIFSPNHFRVLLQREFNAEFSFYEEGLETTVAVYESTVANRPVLVINNSHLADHGIVHKMLAHLPALLHPDPQRALTAGFGVGITSQSFSVHKISVNDCVEISQSVMNAAPQFAALNGNIADRNDENFRLFLNDARLFLSDNTEPYDIIALDANSGVLENAGVGKLYSREFFELCKRRLTDDGIVTVYASPNGRNDQFQTIARTFTDVFPNSTLWVDRVYGETTVMLGTRQPLRINVARYLKRIARPEVQRDLAIFDLDQPGTLLSCFTMGKEMLGWYCRNGVLNTDDHPIMEYHPLHTDLFERNDRPYHDAGFPLHRESVFSLLDDVGEMPDHTRDYLVSAERSFHTQMNAWIFASDKSSENRLRALSMAAELHPDAEHLKSALGYGRADAQNVVVDAWSSPMQIARAGWIALRRNRSEDAAVLFERAIDNAHGNAEQQLLARWNADAALARRSAGQFDQARRLLDEAARLKLDVACERLETDLAEQSASGTADLGLLKRAFQCSAERGRTVRAFALLEKIEGAGGLDADSAEFAGACLVAFGDMSGAYQYYRTALNLDPNRLSAQFGLYLSGGEVALRADLYRKAYSSNDQWRSVLLSPFTGHSVAETELDQIDHSKAEGWLKLAELYATGGSKMMAYRMARVARCFDPENAAAYAAIGETADGKLARLAYEHALKLDPSNRAALSGLAKLDF